MIRNKTYTLEDVKLIYTEEFFKYKLDRLYCKDSLESTNDISIDKNDRHQQHNNSSKATKHRFLFIALVIVGLFILAISILYFQKYSVLFDIKAHLQSWNNLGGHYETDYKPYVDQLNTLVESNKFYAKYEMLSVGGCILKIMQCLIGGMIGLTIGVLGIKRCSKH